jgi:group I intron endonuclease
MRDVLNIASAVVYLATNQINGKRYIGATDKGLTKRRSRHFVNAKKGQQGKFYTAIRKYGPDAFEFKTIRACHDFMEALRYEADAIAEMKPEYNLTAGGGGVKGLKFSDESRAKMAAAKKGKPNHWSNGGMPLEMRERLASYRRAEAGRDLTEKQLRAMRENSSRANGARRRRVVCVTTGVEYDSVTEAAAAHDVTTAMIGYYCRGRFKHRNGLEFKYLK